jgi:hypothetical protein
MQMVVIMLLTPVFKICHSNLVKSMLFFLTLLIFQCCNAHDEKKEGILSKIHSSTKKFTHSVHQIENNAKSGTQNIREFSHWAERYQSDSLNQKSIDSAVVH